MHKALMFLYVRGRQPMALEPDVALLMAAFVKKIFKNMWKNVKNVKKYGSLSQKVALSAKKVADPCSMYMIVLCVKDYIATW